MAGSREIAGKGRGAQESTLLERIHFARKSARDFVPKRSISDFITRYGWYTVLAVLIIVLSSLGFTKGAGFWLVILAASLPPGLAALAARARDARVRRRSAFPLAERPDEHQRLRCVGAPEELLKYGEFRDVAFEPAVFLASFAAPRSRLMNTVGAALAAALMLVGLAVSYVIEGAITYMAIFFVCAGAGAGAIGAAWLWPTYFRLVPGRLELLWYSPFRKRPIERTIVDLRTARILVDLRQFVVVTEAANKPLELSIALMPRRKRFAYMFFLAALSTHEPGPLPEDELVG